MSIHRVRVLQVGFQPGHPGWWLVVRNCAALCIGGRVAGRMQIWTNEPILSLKSWSWHAAALEFPATAAEVWLVSVVRAAGCGAGGSAVWGPRIASAASRRTAAGGLRIGQDGLDCGNRLARERSGLFAPGRVLVATGLGEGLAKNGRTEPIADSVAVDAGGLRGGGGTGGRQGQNALLGRGRVGIGHYKASLLPDEHGSRRGRRG
jgi:hypothetical protein